MKRSFKLENLGCANCAAKMEAAMNKLPGVTASISFMTQRLNFEAEEANFDNLISEAQKIISRLEPECSIVR